MSSRGVNKVILVGNLGADPESRSMPNGNAVTNIRIATSEQWKDKATGDKQEKTEWHSVVFFGKTAEIAAEYLRKGATVYVEGKLQTRKWQDKEGNDRYTTEVVANEMQMIGGKARDAAGYDMKAAEKRAESEQKPARESAPADFDDDIPF